MFFLKNRHIHFDITTASVLRPVKHIKLIFPALKPTWHFLPQSTVFNRSDSSSEANLKVGSATFLLVCFLSLKESTWEIRTKFSLQKLFSFSRKSNFRILDIQMLWRHQMPKHETRNTFYWITCKVNTVCWWNLTSSFHITKEKNLSENSTKIAAWKLVPGPFVFAKN